MTTITGIMDFYQQSNADVLEALDGDGAGVIWTIPPCSPDALKRGIQQLLRCKVTKMRWTRKLCLRSRALGRIDAVGVYSLPDMKQSVYRQDTGEEIKIKLLQDDCLDAVSAALKT